MSPSCMMELPALRDLGTLADIRPTVVVDTREQAPLPFRRLPVVRGTLRSGDYSAVGLESLFAVERKTIADLVSCVTNGRERFERELHRLRGFRFKRLLVVGTREEIKAGRYWSKVNPRSVLHTLSAFEIRYDLPVVFCPTPSAAGELIESWCYWFCREHVEHANNLLRGHKQATALAGGWRPANDCPDIATSENRRDSRSGEDRQHNPTETRDEKAQ